jgi:hypothetical protein
MPPISFTDIPNWLQMILLWVGVITAVLTLIVTIIGFFRKVWPVLKALVERETLLTGLPEFMSKTTASLAAQDVKIAEIHKEVNYNGGGSVKDAINRVEVGVKGIYTRLDSADETTNAQFEFSAKDRADIRQTLEEIRPKPTRKRPTQPKGTL